MPPEFRARIDDDLDQALQAFMEQEGIPKRADAGRRLMELGLAAAGLEPGEQLTMEQALGHLDRAMHVFTVPLVPRGFPSVHESAVVIPAEPKNADVPLFPSASAAPGGHFEAMEVRVDRTLDPIYWCGQ